ncbi:ABC transporter ATP-binding protein [Amycolatopsis antarctica]|uniref:ABC transporter ATP-binding protein n=1 Tax=Amycolatopsis antarctica TaxID=1854586 RepID=A0A263D8C7_9PSEU|nr:ATP-binding cassette domain-containing protein [Amycolatopsis antarctica]OZM73736.1 ABC transporter ATP-binding protein [Amycolatopsis antarctica]
MHDGSGRIAVHNLTKQFGQVTAVQNLSFAVEPGSVTGFLGPNGAGKTTTLRMLLGLVTPTAGTATINGMPHNRLGSPATVVGSVLENEGFHPMRTARNHLRVYAAAIGVADQRVDQVLSLVGLTPAADRNAGGFSLGMRQRLALATALLGDPQVLVLDEPANGLDPEGIAWLRTFLRTFAKEGRTVLVSSHLLAEVEQTIDNVVIVSRGQTMYQGRVDQLRKSQQARVIVRPSDPQALVTALREAGAVDVQPTPDGELAVTGTNAKQVGDVALRAGVAIYGLHEDSADLEKMFFQLTSGQYAGGQYSGGPQARGQGQYGGGQYGGPQGQGGPYGGQAAPGAPPPQQQGWGPPPGGAQPPPGYGQQPGHGQEWGGQR